MEESELVYKIVSWIAHNSELESPYLNPVECCNWKVDSHALLDFICNTSGIDGGQISQWVTKAVTAKKKGMEEV